MRLLPLLLTAALLFVAVVPAAANGTPVKIPLSRLPGVANFGPSGASGQAEITAVEGDVRLAVRGLDRLSNELYQAHLVNTKTNDRLSILKFNTTADGTGQQQAIVPLGNREFDLFVITVEPEPDPNVNPDERIVLAGYWPNRQPGAEATAAAATAVASGLATPAPTTAPGATAVVPSLTSVPTNLPRTGGLGLDVLVFALGVAGTGVALIGRRSKR